MSGRSYTMIPALLALSMMGAGFSSVGDDIMRDIDRDRPPEPPRPRKPRVIVAAKEPIPQGPMTRQQRRAAERAAAKCAHPQEGTPNGRE